MENVHTVRNLLWSYFRDRPWIFVVYIVLMMFHPIRALLVPFYVGRLTSQIGNTDASWKALRKLVICIVSLWALSLVLQGGKGIFDAFIGPDFQMHVRNGGIDTILNAYRRNYRELETGDINVKLYQLPYAAFWAVKTMLDRLAPTLLTVVVGVAFLFRIHRVLGWVFVSFIVIYAMAMGITAMMLLKMYTDASGMLDMLHEDVDDFVGNLFALYITNTITSETTRLQKITQLVRKLWQKVELYRACLKLACNFLKYAFVALMLIAIVYLRRHHGFADVAAGLFITMSLESIIYEMVVTFVDLLSEVADLGKIEAFYDGVAERVVAAPPPARDNRPLPADFSIIYRNLSVVYPGQTRPALRQVFATIVSGSRVLVTGHIGSGKSTLAKLLVGLHPYTGSLTIGGHEVRDMSSTEIHKSITYIPQAPRLFKRTVLENIKYGLTGVSDAQVAEVLSTLNLPRFPAMDKMAGKNGSALSGGQRTIIYLIRGVLQNSPIVILDEPTAALDPDTKEELRRSVNRLLEGKTTIIITHDFSTNWNPTQHFHLDKGILHVQR